MAKLSERAKVFVVQALACRMSPTDVALQVKQELGIQIGREHVNRYDPTKGGRADLSPHLRAIFWATRERFFAEIALIPIAQQAVRLRALQREFERAKARGDVPLLLKLLEVAAKEVGGAYTNCRALSYRRSFGGAR